MPQLDPVVDKCKQLLERDASCFDSFASNASEGSKGQNVSTKREKRSHSSSEFESDHGASSYRHKIRARRQRSPSYHDSYRHTYPPPPPPPPGLQYSYYPPRLRSTTRGAVTVHRWCANALCRGTAGSGCKMLTRRSGVTARAVVAVPGAENAAAPVTGAARGRVAAKGTRRPTLDTVHQRLTARWVLCHHVTCRQWLQVAGMRKALPHLMCSM